MRTPSERYVLLEGGLTVPVGPWLLLLDLEARGLRVTRQGERILVSPAGHLTDEDRAALTRWRYHVLALLDYEPPAEGRH